MHELYIRVTFEIMIVASWNQCFKSLFYSKVIFYIKKKEKKWRGNKSRNKKPSSVFRLWSFKYNLVFWPRFIYVLRKVFIKGSFVRLCFRRSTGRIEILQVPRRVRVTFVKRWRNLISVKCLQGVRVRLFVRREVGGVVSWRR